MSDERKKIGLALSGGGIRAAAHIGMLKFLEEKNIRPDIIAGNSAGAIVAVLYAAGKKPEEILEIFQKVKLFDFSNIAWDEPGLLDTDEYMEAFEEYLEPESFEELDIQIRIAAADILEGKLKIFDSGPLIKTMLASSALPGIFSPVDIGQSLYQDGGLFNNFPADVIRESCNYLIGMNVNPLNAVKKENLTDTLDIIGRALELFIGRQSNKNRECCDLYISPMRLVEFGIFNQEKIEDAFEIGYEESRKLADRFERLM
ncbi:MAG: patatin-like phospholipase family protein [Saprospiraceae bacterium]|nr:patatin-like phospholipase family protein [Saprospiraceae bacterium]